MMKILKLKVLFILAFCLSMVSVHGQLGIGQWRSHPSGHQGKLVTQSENSVYVSHGNSLMRYYKGSGTIVNWNSINALTDIRITALEYDSLSSILMVGYENGNLDLIKNNTVFNIPSIRLSNVIGLKSIQRITFYQGLAYVCTGFGIVVVDPINYEVKDTYYPTTNNYFVYDIEFFDGKIFVATENGIYYGTIGSPLLPAPGAWTPISGIDINGRYSELEASGNRLFFLRDLDTYSADTILYMEQNGTVVKNPTFPVRTYNHLNNHQDTLLIAFEGGAYAYDTTLAQVENIWQYPFDTYPVMNQIIKDGLDYWIADENYGLVFARNAYQATDFNSGGPYRLGSFKIDLVEGKLGIVGGYIDAIGNSSYNQSGFNFFENENWINFHRNITPEIDRDTIFDFTGIAVNPSNTNQVFVTSASYFGAFEINGGFVTNSFTQQNSAFQKRSILEDYYVVTDLSYDYDGNLWFANSFCNEQLVVKTPDNLWYSYDLGAAGKNVLLYELFVDYSNLKWIGTRGNGIIVYDDNGTPDNFDDDRTKNLTTVEGNGGLPSPDVFCMTMDFDEEIWVGTSAGLRVIYSPQLIWDGQPGEFDAAKILVEKDGFNEILLGETPIMDIEVDGGNRKWIATQGSGVFLISEDGQQEIHHFTAENSPLLSNNVFDLDINHKSGEVFFGTELGLCSFRSDATYGDFEFSDVFSYPNPVTPEFTDDITITGFAFDSDVRITDIAGNLVYRTTSNGGTVLWNCKTTQGERVKSGVYVVWAGEKNDKGKAVTKILVIN